MTLTAIPSTTFLATDGQDSPLFAAMSELTVAQAAEFLRTSERHLNDLLDAGQIVSRHDGGLRMVQWDSLLKFEQWRERGHAVLMK